MLISRKSNTILWIIASAIFTIAFLGIFVSDAYQQAVTIYLGEHRAAAPLIVIGARFVSNVIAPLPGSPTAFASIAMLPWWQAFLYNFLGVQLGSILSFFIARRFRELAVARFAQLQRVHEWQERVSQRQQFAAFLALRFLSIFAYDFVSYAAGLSKLPFRTFLAASVLVDVPVMFLFFYFGAVAYRYGIVIMVGFALLLFGGAYVASKRVLR